MRPVLEAMIAETGLFTLDLPDTSFRHRGLAANVGVLIGRPQRTLVKAH